MRKVFFHPREDKVKIIRDYVRCADRQRKTRTAKLPSIGHTKNEYETRCGFYGSLLFLRQWLGRLAKPRKRRPPGHVTETEENSDAYAHMSAISIANARWNGGQTVREVNVRWTTDSWRNRIGLARRVKEVNSQGA